MGTWHAQIMRAVGFINNTGRWGLGRSSFLKRLDLIVPDPWVLYHLQRRVEETLNQTLLAQLLRVVDLMHEALTDDMPTTKRFN